MNKPLKFADASIKSLGTVTTIDEMEAKSRAVVNDLVEAQKALQSRIESEKQVRKTCDCCGSRTASPFFLGEAVLCARCFE